MKAEPYELIYFRINADYLNHKQDLIITSPQ